MLPLTLLVSCSFNGVKCHRQFRAPASEWNLGHSHSRTQHLSRINRSHSEQLFHLIPTWPRTNYTNRRDFLTEPLVCDDRSLQGLQVLSSHYVCSITCRTPPLCFHNNPVSFASQWAQHEKAVCAAHFLRYTLFYLKQFHTYSSYALSLFSHIRRFICLHKRTHTCRFLL